MTLKITTYHYLTVHTHTHNFLFFFKTFFVFFFCFLGEAVDGLLSLPKKKMEVWEGCNNFWWGNVFLGYIQNPKRFHFQVGTQHKRQVIWVGKGQVSNLIQRGHSRHQFPPFWVCLFLTLRGNDGRLSIQNYPSHQVLSCLFQINFTHIPYHLSSTMDDIYFSFFF